MNMKRDLGNRIKGWLPREPKIPTQVLHQPMLKTEIGPLFTGLGVGLVVLGLGFCFFSSYYIDGNLPLAVVLDIIRHYLEGIAVGCAFLTLGVVLIVFGMKKSQNYFSTQIQAVKNWIDGWIPKEYRVAFAQKVSKPSWWKPLWIVSVLGIIISALVLFLIGYTPLERIILGVIFAFLGLGGAYYIRVRPSITVNRVVYIGLGIGIGWFMWIIYAVSGIGLWLNGAIGGWPSLIIGFAVPYTIGAIIGDRIGRYRNYQLPLFP